MNILHIHNWYRFDGGENTMFKIIVHSLREKGHHVVILERNSQDITSGVRGRTEAFLEGIYSFTMKKSVSKLLALERPDIVHVHNLYPLISPSVLIPCREARIPVVMRCPNYRMTCPTSLHLRNGNICELCKGGREYWCLIKNCRGNLLESFGYAIRNVVARKKHLFHDNVTFYLPPTEFVKHRLVDCGIREEQIVVIPNMVEMPNDPLDYSEGQYIAYTGRISPEKGIDTLLVAAFQTGLPVRIAGDYLAMPGALEMAPQNVKFLGHLGPEKLHEFYQNSRFVIVPSIWHETFGLVAAEAMAHGLPVIASRMGGLPELVEDGTTGFLFEAGDARDLGQKMKVLWNDPELCRRMGKKARVKAGLKYSKETYYRRLMEVYERAIDAEKEKQSSTTN